MRATYRTLSGGMPATQIAFILKFNMFTVELVWNREFHFVPHKDIEKIEDAILHAKQMENSGDGARVKKTRIVDQYGKIIWQYGQMME